MGEAQYTECRWEPSGPGGNERLVMREGQGSWSSARVWEGLATGAPAETLALAESWMLTHGCRREAGALVEIRGAPAQGFSDAEGTRCKVAE